MKRRFNPLPLLLFTFLFILINVYAANGLQNIFVYPHFTKIYYATGFIFILILFIAIFRWRKKGLNKAFMILGHIFLIALASISVFAAMLFLGDIYRTVEGIFQLITQHHFYLNQRSSIWLYISFGMLLLTIFTFIYGMWKGKYAYRVIKHQLHFENLPPAFDGFTIAQISDIHAGSFTSAKAVQRGINLIKAQKSDLFVFTGDLVNNQAHEIEPYISYFSQIKAPYGQFSVLGNHDYGDYHPWPSAVEKKANLDQLKDNHKALGYRLLLDEHVNIVKNNQKIVLLGIENWGIGFGERGDLNKALHQVADDDFKILLSHDPSHWEAEVKNHEKPIQLTLAGHTHGMQFGIEFLGLKWSPVKYRYPHWAGLKNENGRYININRGFGFIGFSGRVGIWPEITVIELKRSAIN